MNVLIYSNSEILVALGRQPRFKNKNYRLNKFCLIEDIMNGKLIYNGLTRSFVFITNKEFSKIYDKDLNDDYIKFLYENWFLIEENFDEFEFIREFREKNRVPVDDFYLKTVKEYTILTTTACNARCFYCYEQKVKKNTMTVETAEKILEYIKNHSSKDEVIEIRWFGGEPLYNTIVMDTICYGLIDNGYTINSHITTNGYLFDESNIDKAVNLWHITSCQITLDGTEEVYNKAKNYKFVKDNESPYKRVINNISMLINNGISVGVRMNVDLYNGDDLKDLVYELYNRFGNHPNLYLYCYPIFENEFYSRTDEERHKVFEKMEEIEQVMTDCNFFSGSQLSYGIRLNHCMVDDGKSITFSPKGEIGLCEHCVDYDFMGHVDKPDELDMNVIKSWKVYEKDLDICSDCPNFPNCVRASKCEEQSKCYPEYKDWLVRKQRQGMRTTYYNIMNERNN